MELTGKVISVMPLQTGEGKNGQWKKQEFVVESEGQFPKKVCFSLWGDKVDGLQNATPGTPIKVSFDVESREYNGKWYTDAKAWKIEVGGGFAASAPNFQNNNNSGGQVGNSSFNSFNPSLPAAGESDDLPF